MNDGVLHKWPSIGMDRTLYNQAIPLSRRQKDKWMPNVLCPLNAYHGWLRTPDLAAIHL